ncbi:MAG: hypothetical protein IJI01_01700 [Butyrivibrio sp.]|uniref:hypothetical protein n=1 Tax=Butyrivibrio sp. TaxID=28121 RepID=UPI0025BF8A3D|nr:hypothetical protein [Butyrivibrio sp.]MBQ6587375.1 hypothetical protein [Butyrivibrio sp.]
MRIKGEYKTLTVYLFSILVVLPFFSSEIGISLGEMKICISDFVIFYVTAIYILNVISNGYRFNVNTELKWWIVLLLLWIIMIPFGVLNGGKISECIRLIRVILYIPTTFFLFNKYIKRYVSELLSVISLIVAANTIINALFLYKQYKWFMFYRANGILTVILFCFKFFEIFSNKKYVYKYVNGFCCLILLVASFFSQERTQLITIALSCMLTSIIMIIKNRGVHLKKNRLANRIIVFVAGFAVLLLVYKLVTNVDIFKKYIDYYVEYRLRDGNIVQLNELHNDGSAKGRLFQFESIISDSMNPVYFIIGRGTCAHYIALQGDTYIVDSAALWVLKDLGIIGLFILIICCLQLIHVNKNVTCDYSVLSAAISIVMFMFYNPSFIYTISAAFTVGMVLFLKNYSIDNNNKSSII